MGMRFSIGSSVIYVPAGDVRQDPYAGSKAVVTPHPHTDRHQDATFIAFPSGIVLLVQEDDLALVTH
jgi:hypothetical protein